MSLATLVSLFVIKTGMLVVGQSSRGVLVEMPANRGVRRIEMVSWQDVEASV